ncbi:hypothetical protein [Catenulispora rubra]|uniref:hypothetical protein n=1 Tax=Catenulispora rubra TaxID=280293 RepID=UPI0018923C0C|nr:hypothetical protein [Catenulispora rubra]
MTIVVFGNHTPTPPPGWSFRIAEIHLDPASAPWFTGTWHRTGTQPNDPSCALWLTVAAEEPQAVTVTLRADDPARYGQFRTPARFSGIRADAWTQIIAPAVAAHPWSCRVQYPRSSKTPDRLARALLAHLIVNR